MIQYLIGVDGGGSGTRVRLANPDGVELARGAAGPSSLAYGVEAAWAAIQEAVAQAFAAAAIARPAPAKLAIGLGLAGVHTKQWAASFLRHDPGYTTIALETDAHTALLGAHGGRPGAVVAIGTGSVGEALRLDGQRHSVGGWGFPAGDEGGGAWIGLRAMGHAQRVRDGRAAPGALADAVSAACGGDADAIRAWVGVANQGAFAKLSSLVVEHGAGDPAARAILDEAGRHVARIALALDPDRGLPLALCGGLAQPLAPHLPAELRERLVPARADAAAGALQLIRHCLDQGRKAKGALK